MAITKAFEKGEPTLGDVTHAYEKARRAGLSIIEREARKVLAADESLTEFVMGMGTAFFNDINDDMAEIDDVDSADDLKLLLSDWDEVFKFTGESMRFTADGPVVRDW